MSRLKRASYIQNVATYIFLAVEISLYLAFMALDFTNQFGHISNCLKYSSILCCAFLSVLRFFLAKRSRFHAYLAIALCFTAVSDYFLLFSSNYIPGLVSFCVVQTAYLGLITYSSLQKPVRFHLTVRIITALILGVALFLLTKESLAFLLPLSLYAVSFIANIVLSCKAHLRQLSIGLILFALCDINVFLFNLSDYIFLPDAFITFFNSCSGILMWLFYLPAQVILTLLKDTGEARN